MSYGKQHVLLTWGGTLPGGESWSCSLRTAPMPIVPGFVRITDGDLSGLAASYVPAVKTYHQSAQLQISNQAKLTWVKLAAIDLSGKYVPDQLSVLETTFVGLPGIAGGQPPNQIALCVSTTTDQIRGYAHAGRFYLPMPTFQPATDGRITQSDADFARQASKTFLEAIADVPGIDNDISPTPVVMSKHGNGTTRKITGVRIGRVLDTQRRRRSSVPEGYEYVGIDTGTF
jgi:hypothetical protein